MSGIVNQLNWIDIFFIILLFGMGYKGIRMGISGQLFSVAGWIALIFISLNYYKYMSEAIFGFSLQTWGRPMAFLLSATAIFFVIKLFQRIFHIVAGDNISIFERIGGFALATFKAFIFCGVLGIFFLLLPVNFLHTALTINSKTGMFFVNLDFTIYDLIVDVAKLQKKVTKQELLDKISANKGTGNKITEIGCAVKNPVVKPLRQS